MTPSSPGPDDGALRRAVLRNRVRTISEGRVDPDPATIDGAVLGVVDDGLAYLQTDDHRGLGPALRWALSGAARKLCLIAESEVAGELARRAALVSSDLNWSDPVDVEVWSARGTEVEPARPSAIVEPPPVPLAHRPFAALISEAGARPIDDHGMLIAEVAGLEVARVVDEDGEGPRLAVGVGQADRELQGYLHGHLDDDAKLRRAIAAVARDRRPGAASHPLTRLARQRWLRSILLDDPGILGLDELEPVVPLCPRETLLGQEPAAARGSGAVVVCSVGVDLDLLPEAVDYRHREDPTAELIVVVPERDRRLAAGPLDHAEPGLRLVSADVPWG